MKQFFIFVLFLILLIAQPLHAVLIKVVATTEDLAAIAREVGSEKVQVQSLARGEQDPHFLEAKPSLILKLSQADLLVEVGLDLESGWLPALKIGARNGKILNGALGNVDASIGIMPIDIPTGPIDRSAGDVHAQGNPHYHLDPENEKQMARNIAEGLKRIDPANASRYDQNLTAFINRLDVSILGWQEKLKPFAGEKIVTYHNSWPYFLKRFGIVSVGHLEPKPGIPPTTAHLMGLVELMKRERVKIIVMEPYFSDQTPKFIAEKTGAKVIVLPPSVSAGSGIKDTLAHFDRLVNTLVEALGGTGPRR